MKPTITINGKEFEIKVKAKLWRIVSEFNEKRKNKQISTADFVDEHCKIIAAAYGLTVDEVLNDMDLEDVIPACVKVINYIGEKLAEKSIKKNLEEIN